MKRVALAGTVAVLAACSQEPTGPVNKRQAEPPTDARSELAAAAAGRTARGFEDEILRLENAVPGLGGLYKDAQGRATVYLSTPGDRGALLRQLAGAAANLKVDRALRSDLQAGRVTVRDGRFAFSQLVAWQRQVLASLTGVGGVRSVDADESINQVRVTLVEGTPPGPTDQAIAASGVPRAAILVDFGKPLYSNSLLTDRFRPTGGGILIQNAASEGCTLGFNVTTVTYHETGYLTASHCAGGAPWLGSTGGTMYQNTNASVNQYGVVDLNTAFTRTDPGCMGNPNCAWADVMFVLTGAADFAKIVAAPTFVGQSDAVGSTTLAGWWNQVTKAGFTPYTGLTIDKVGYRSGWTRGGVAQTCAAVTVASRSGNYVVLCADAVNGSAIGNGDSGSPVLIPPGTDPSVEAFGILFAGTTNGTDICDSNCTYYFSDWSAIEGQLPRTFNYNTPTGLASVTISGPTQLKSGMTCHWTATSNIDAPQFTWSVNDGTGDYDVGTGPDLFYAFVSPPAHQGLSVRVTNYENQNASASKLMGVSTLNRGCN